MQVLTIKGPLEFEALTVRDVVSLVPNGRKVATEYYLGDELVKRTVTVDVLMPLTSEAAQGNFNG
jgi:hypothetical protein